MATGTTHVSSVVGRDGTLPHIKVSVLKEGNLLKRQRGRSSGVDLRKLKWQQRYISLTPDYLYYYIDQKVRPTMMPRTTSYIIYPAIRIQKGEKKGEFSVKRMRIVEKVPDSTFHTSNCMQVSWK